MARKGFERELPSDHAKMRETLEKAALERDEELERKKARELAAFDWLLQQENGRIVLAWFFKRCGYNQPVLMRMAQGDVAPLSTECAAAQREVYRDFRKMISSPELLAAAEFEAEFGVVRKKDETVKGDKK